MKKLVIKNTKNGLYVACVSDNIGKFNINTYHFSEQAFVFEHSDQAHKAIDELDNYMDSKKLEVECLS